MMDATLVDRIYEASFLPEMWSDILDEISALSESKGGLLFAARDQVFRWTSSDNLEDVFQSYVNDGWFAKCDRRVCMFSKAHAAFLKENDYWTEEELATNPIYEKFFRPRGLGWSAGTGLLMPTGDSLVISVERTFERGPMEDEFVERLNSLRPHLARSAMVAGRLGLKSAKGAAETLGKLGLPTILFGTGGNVVETHNLSEETERHIVFGAYDQFAFKDKNANDLLKGALDALHVNAKSAVQSFPIRDEDHQAVLVAHLIPISGAANDIFAKSYALLALTSVTAKNVPSVELVRSLFDLTASEARVARSLAGGNTVEDIADKGGVALTTVRTQLRHVMEKTGCSRQAEIVALMANMSLQHRS